MKTVKRFALLLPAAVLLTSLAACQKPAEPTAAGPAEQAGRQLDKAGRDITAVTEQARIDLAKAAKESGERLSKAGEQAGVELNKTAEKVGAKVEQAGEKIQESAREARKE